MIHGLLHIADGIEAAGLVWAVWAFVMERYCGWVKRRAVRSRKHALKSIDNRILETTQLEMVKMRYGLTKKLSLKPKHSHTSKDKFSNCEYHSNYYVDLWSNNIHQILSTQCWTLNEHFPPTPLLNGSLSM